MTSLGGEGLAAREASRGELAVEVPRYDDSEAQAAQHAVSQPAPVWG